MTGIGLTLNKALFVATFLSFVLSWIEWLAWLRLSPRLQGYGVPVLRRTHKLPRPVTGDTVWFESDKGILRLLNADVGVFRRRTSFWSLHQSSWFPIYCRLCWQGDVATIVGRIPVFSVLSVSGVLSLSLIGGVIIREPVFFLVVCVFCIICYAVFAMERERTLTALEELGAFLQRGRRSNTALQPAGAPGSD